MQDITQLPEINLDSYLTKLKDKPLDEEILKYKTNRLMSIGFCNEKQYMGDLEDVYAWILLCNRRISFKELMPNEKLQKIFAGDFLVMCVKDLIACKKFHLNQMMLLTEQFFVECLIFFNNNFAQLDKFPTLATLPSMVLKKDRLFYKQNAITQYPHLVVQPTPEQVILNNTFVDQLKEGDIVECIKTQMHGNRLCWSRALVKKITSLSVYVVFENDRSTTSRNVDKTSFEIVPLYTYTKDDYDWRLNLKIGDKIDYEMTRGWVTTEIEDIKTITYENRIIYELKLKSEDASETYDEWTISTSSKVQKPGLILNQEFGYDNTLNHHDIGADDFNDLILDQERKGKNLIIRQDVMKSLLYIDLANHLESLGGFQKILEATKAKKIGVQVCAHLASFVGIINSMFHRSFALKYLKEYSQALLNYIKDLDENNIRNLSKERLTDILAALNEFISKLLPVQEKKSIIQQLQLSLALRFIDSDFLERKMQAVTIFTQLLKQSTNHHFHHSVSIKTAQLFGWFEKNDIIRKIFNEKSHPQLIARGTDFLQTYLVEQQNPQSKSFDALLEYTEPLLKLNNELFDYLPKELKERLVEKISVKKGITNKDALEIMKKYGGNELWFLQNGGQFWVDVIRGKKKRAEDIVEVFKQPFNVVLKITEEISKCYDGRLRNEYFQALLESDYVEQVFKIQVPLVDKVRFLKLILENALYLEDPLFESFISLWQTHSQSDAPEFNELFETVVSKLSRDQVKTFFEKFFEDEEKLITINKGGFKIFSQLFIKINQILNYIEKQITQYYGDVYPLRRERKQVITITVNPVKLQGMNNLMFVVFESKSSEVIQVALNFISFLFNHLAPSLSESIVEFKDNFLQQCLEKLYKSTDPSKYLQIVKSILDQSQIEGNGNLPSIQAALPGQKQKYVIIDCFSAIKKKFQIQVESHITVFEFRFLLGKQVGAFTKEITLSVNKKPIIDMLNGYTLRQANLGQPILIERKTKIERANLTDNHGKLTEEAKAVFKKIFGGYSTNGLMSKQECLKFYQKCVGENSTYTSETKVDNIYQTNDSNKDGYLELQEFLNFYEISARQRESVVWTNLQSFGVRLDLKILDDLQISHVDPTVLIRHLLINDQRFMTLLFKTLESNNNEDRINSWGLLERLPLYQNTDYQFNLQNPYHLKYWLYLVDVKDNQKQITKDILYKICNSDAQTLAIGLKSAVQLEGLDLTIFQKLIDKLNEINKKSQLSVFEQVSLDYSLALIVKCLNKEKSVQQQFIEHKEKYLNLFLNGLLSTNKDVRQKYVSAVWNILQFSCDHTFEVFEILFNLLYKHFETSTKSGLYPEFFEIFSKTLELIRNKDDVLKSLKLDWSTLTKSVIERFKTHKCTEERLSSPPDWVMQGFMHILSRLLEEKTAKDLEQLIPYLFQTLLFPDGGTNKLKTSTTRKQAYELIYTICKHNPHSLQELFKSGFKKIYKTVANTKAQSFSYFYSYYNDVRADNGYAGIRNLGCICYMLAMIQQFYMTRPLRYLMLMADDKLPQCLVKKGLKEIDDNILHQFQQMFANLELTERQQYNPQQFCFSFKDFDGNPVNVSVQQDAQQFLNMLFDKIERGLSSTPFKKILQSIYGGVNCSQLICASCKNIKEGEQHYYNISLEIKGFKNYDQSFKKYIQGEVISDFMCSFCKKNSEVTKRSLLSELPNYLIVHLQRICFNYDKFQNQKVNSRWEFPDDLNVYNYTVDKQRNLPNSEHYEYKLKGIVVHIGSAEYGHYFSYIKTSETQWLQFNDERVRDFDPDDIENECFGGEQWRRENQSAYLLVYEKKIKKQITMEFESKQQMEAMEKAFELPLVEEKPKIEKESSDQKEEKEEPEEQKEPEKPKLLASLDIQKVPYYVPDKLVSKINKSNEEFSMSLNVSNTEFAYFIYRILSIQPPESLKGEFIQLCHECFHFKQQLENDESLSEWMIKRFKELIVGSGWRFYDQAVKAWEKDILSSQKTTRIAVKNVLVSVLTDIMTPELLEFEAEKPESEATEVELLSNQQPKQESISTKIKNFLYKALEMMDNEVSKQWQRFQQYFEFWYDLLKYNNGLLKYAKASSMMEKLLDFVMQQHSPFKTKQKTKSYVFKFSQPPFQAPFEVIGLLIESGYHLSPIEEKCLGHIAYLQKLISFHPQHSNLIQYSCKNNAINTERVAYLILYNTNKIAHSNNVKPIMSITYKFLAIQDDLRPCRIEWLMGYSQLVYSYKLDSFGMAAISNIIDDRFLKFKSGLRYDSMIQLTENNRDRLEHIAARLVTLLLELEEQGYINLSQYESPLVLNKDYTSWIPTFARKYYDEYRNHTTDYALYGDRLMDLINNRKPIQRTQPIYLIGITIEKSQVYKKTHESIQITLESYTVPLVLSKPTFLKNESVPSDLVSYRSGMNTRSSAGKKYPGSQRFISIPISTSNFSFGSSLREEESRQTAAAPDSDNPFANPIISDYIYKLTFKNISQSTQIIVVKFSKTQNVDLPLCPISFEIEPRRQEFFTAHKINAQQPMPEIKYQIQVFEQQPTEKYGKKMLTQLITSLKDEEGIDVNSDEDNHFYY